MSNLVSQAECARQLSVSRQAIHKHVTRGLLPLVDGKIDIDRARELLAAELDPARSKIQQQSHVREVATTPVKPQPPAGASVKPPPGAMVDEDETPSNYHLARTLRETYEAKRARLAFQQESGELVKAVDVKTAAAKIATVVANGLDMLPARLGAQLANEPDIDKRETLIEAECNTIRAELFAAVQDLLPPDADA